MNAPIVTQETLLLDLHRGHVEVANHEMAYDAPLLESVASLMRFISQPVPPADPGLDIGWLNKLLKDVAAEKERAQNTAALNLLSAPGTLLR